MNVENLKKIVDAFDEMEERTVDMTSVYDSFAADARIALGLIDEDDRELREDYNSKDQATWFAQSKKTQEV